MQACQNQVPRWALGLGANVCVDMVNFAIGTVLGSVIDRVTHWPGASCTACICRLAGWQPGVPPPGEGNSNEWECLDLRGLCSGSGRHLLEFFFGPSLGPVPGMPGKAGSC